MAIRVEPIAPHCGAIVRGVDLSKDLTDHELEAIRDAFAAHSVLFFRDQDLGDPVRFKAFASHFGELYGDHPAAEGSSEHPEVMRMHHDHNSTYIAGSSWHSDQSSDAEPPMATMLWNHTVPDVGGDTLFSSMYAAYDALSARMKQYLDGLTAVHDAEHVFRPITPDWSKRFTSAVHPVVRTHPVTGRRALFVNQLYTTRIVEVPKSESRGILELLFRHVEDPMFQCRFRWEPGSLAFWDNRCTQHVALWDYYPRTRSGFRITIKGDRPV